MTIYRPTFGFLSTVMRTVDRSPAQKTGDKRMITIRIALVGDYSSEVPAHRAIPGALERAASLLGQAVAPTWIASPAWDHDPAGGAAAYNGLWCVPGSPYASMDGALGAIRAAREGDIPFLGTCGGFQHALIEYVRNVRGHADADHAESNPDTTLPLIAPLACPLRGARGTIRFTPGSRAHAIYDREEATEEYYCGYGVNPPLESMLEDGALHISGRDAEGAARVVELDGHPFYIATLFQPERATLAGGTHPLINAFVASALARIAAPLRG
jgi:CTP synthase (UTP-ammonia lyase)